MARSEASKKSTVPVTEVTTWEVSLWPRNTEPAVNTFAIEVVATSKQEAINKALSQYPGHAWGTIKKMSSRVYVDPKGELKASHEGSKIHDVDDRKPYIGSYHTIVEDAGDPAFDGNTPAGTTWLGDAVGPGAEQPGLWSLRPWEPTRREGEELALQTIIGEAIGTGSMCWLPKPEGVFNSEMAKWVTGGAINEIEKLIYEKTGYTHNELKKSYPYISDLGEHIIIGPECFANKEQTSIMWKGRHFRAIPDQPETLAALINQALSGRVSLEEVVTRAYNSGYEDHIADVSNEAQADVDYENDQEVRRTEYAKGIAPEECGHAEEPEEAKQWRIQRQADQASVIELILHYKNPASDEEKLRQIAAVMA